MYFRGDSDRLFYLIDVVVLDVFSYLRIFFRGEVFWFLEDIWVFGGFITSFRSFFFVDRDFFYRICEG